VTPLRQRMLEDLSPLIFVTLLRLPSILANRRSCSAQSRFGNDRRRGNRGSGPGWPRRERSNGRHDARGDAVYSRSRGLLLIDLDHIRRMEIN
jgi:hypothetical protein